MAEVDVDAFVDEIADRISSYIRSKDEQGQVSTATPYTTLKRVLDTKLPMEGFGIDHVLDDLDVFLKYSIHTHRPEFMNPLWGGLSLPALAAEMIASMTNNSMYTYELSPVATLIETTLIQRMCELVGYPDGFGTFTTGGSNGNLLGLLCARESYLPHSTQMGFDGRHMAIFVSKESHYSVLMAANVIGIGHQNVFAVECNEHGVMSIQSLIFEIEMARKQGLTPFCVVATSGTTVRGAFDPIDEIAQVAHRESLWLHVDAAWGGSCLFSSTHRQLMNGVELADSVCWDAHKMMGMPLVCSAFLIKSSSVLKRLCQHTNVAHYLFHEEAEENDLGRYSLQCARRNDALKLWIEWRMRGDAGWARMVDNYMRLASHLEQSIISHPSLELMSSRQWTNVCFRYRPKSESHDLNMLNSILRTRLLDEGQFMVSRSTLGDDVILRPVIANQNLTTKTIDSLIQSIVRIGDEIIAGIPAQH